MFFLVRNLKTALNFNPHDMDRLHSEKAIIQMLRDKMEGLCFNDLGFIVKIAKDQMAYTDESVIMESGPRIDDVEHDSNPRIKNFLVSTPEVDENGIKVAVTFSAICFKAEKNDLIQFKVSYVGEESIKGYIGPVEIIAPRNKMEGFEYNRDDNSFISRTGSEGKIVKIDKGTKIIGKCINSNIEFNVNMKILVEIPRTMTSFIENDYQ